ncbi:Nuclear pore complex protein Nup160 homolog, partial [Gryllus bimaculatus]
MGDNGICFREVTPDQLFPEKWKDFTVNIGGTQALQEIKVPERAGGYAYKDQVKIYSRNRFLYWRTSHDTLELVEQSLDVNLVGNALRIRFQDTPVLEGVSVHEAEKAIVVLVATVSSVHRLSFPHPDHLCSEDTADFALAHHPDIGIKSIFADTTLSSVRDPSSFHVLNSVASGIGLPHVSASLLTVQGDSLFALGYPSGSNLLVQMGAGGQEVMVRELKEETFVPRFLSGITHALIGGRGVPTEAPVSLALHCIGLETYLFCLHRDGILAMWSCSRVALMSTLDLAQVCGSEPGQHATEGVQSHVLRKAQDARDGRVLLAAFLCFAEGSQVCLAKPSLVPGGASFRLNLLCTVPAPAGDLVELALAGGALWAAWRGPRGPLVSRAALGAELGPWRMALLEPPPDVEAALRDDADVAEQYLHYVFHGHHFSAPVIARALA